MFCLHINPGLLPAHQALNLPFPWASSAALGNNQLLMETVLEEFEE